MNVMNTTICYYRILSAFLVVCIHVHMVWARPRAIESVAVPLFSCIAGYFWYRTLTKSSGGWVLGFRVKRILLPYLFWSFVYWIANDVFLDGFVRHQSIRIPSLHSLVDFFLYGSVSAHLWFLACLFYVTIVSWCLWYLLGQYQFILGWVLLVLVIVCIGGILLICDSPSSPILEFLRLYGLRLGAFFGIGCIFAVIPPNTWNRTVVHFLVITLCVLGTLALFVFPGLITCAPLVVGAMGVALVWPNLPLPAILRSCSDSSMGIYLVHLLLTSGMYFFLQKRYGSELPISVGLMVALTVFFLSWGIVESFKRVPVLKGVF